MVEIMFIGASALIVVAGMLLFYARKKQNEVDELLDRSHEKLKNMKRDIENERREALLRVKDEVHKRRFDFESDIRKERADFDKQQQRLAEKYEQLERKEGYYQDKYKCVNKLRAGTGKYKTQRNNILNQATQTCNEIRLILDDEMKQLLKDIRNDIKKINTT